MSKSMDIVDRLRSPGAFIMDGPMISPVAFEAASEIENLRAEVAHLRQLSRSKADIAAEKEAEMVAKAIEAHAMLKRRVPLVQIAKHFNRDPQSVRHWLLTRNDKGQKIRTTIDVKARGGWTRTLYRKTMDQPQ